VKRINPKGKNDMKKSLIWLMIVFSYAAVFSARAEFTTGTNDDGVYYFPQRMAEWCSMNFNSNLSEATIKDCFNKICSEMASKNYEVATKAKQNFRKMKMESVVNAFITAHEANKKYANSKEEDKAAETNDKAAESERTQTSGNAEIKKNLLQQETMLNLLKATQMELDVMDALENHCAIFVVKGDAQ